MARVLVVDDAAFMRKMVTDALTQGGHEVVGEAGNGLEAVERFQELKPEVTTLDITMPEKDGLTALREIIALDPRRAGDHVLRPRSGEQGARVDQGRRQGLRRQAVPGGPRHRRRRQGARLARPSPRRLPHGRAAASARAARAKRCISGPLTRLLDERWTRACKLAPKARFATHPFQVTSSLEPRASPRRLAPATAHNEHGPRPGRTRPVVGRMFYNAQPTPLPIFRAVRKANRPIAVAARARAEEVGARWVGRTRLTTASGEPLEASAIEALVSR